MLAHLKMGQNIHFCFRSGLRWLTPLTVSLTVKYPFFTTSCDSYKNETTLNYTGDDFDLLVSPPGLKVGKKHVSEIFNI